MPTRPNSLVLLFILLLAAAFTGCAASPWAAKSEPGSEIAPGGGPVTTPGPRMTPAGNPTPKMPAPSPPVPSPMAAGGSAPSPQALQQVMGEIERLGAVDPRAQAQLLEELKQVDPSLWPMAVQSVWSRVAYARRFNQEQQNKNLADRRSADVDGRRREINLRADYPTTAPTVPTVRPQHDGYNNGHIERIPTPPDAAPPQSGPNRASAPPWPSQGAALDAADTHATAAAAARPSGVIHTAYHADPSESDGPIKHDGPIKRDGTADDDWQARLDEAVTALESRLAAADSKGAGADNSRSADHARLRIMQLLAGRRDDALAEMPGDDTAVRDFWAKEIFGLDILLDTRRFSRDSNRAAEAKRHLSDAARSLGESATLEVRNMAFCREVQSFGSIKRFEKHEFSPGQRLLLYAEIDNFRSENTAKGYHTSLRSSFQIFDHSGRRIDNRPSTTTEELCLGPRRDYFIGCDFRLPTSISPGRHTLKLTVEDLKSHKVGESSIDFSIVKR